MFWNFLLTLSHFIHRQKQEAVHERRRQWIWEKPKWTGPVARTFPVRSKVLDWTSPSPRNRTGPGLDGSGPVQSSSAAQKIVLSWNCKVRPKLGNATPGCSLFREQRFCFRTAGSVQSCLYDSWSWLEPANESQNLPLRMMGRGIKIECRFNGPVRTWSGPSTDLSAGPRSWTGTVAHVRGFGWTGIGLGPNFSGV